MKKKLTAGQVASMVLAGLSFMASNWDFIGPHIDRALQSSWFVAHPHVKIAVTGFAALVVLYREWRHRHPAQAGSSQAGSSQAGSSQAGSSDTPTNGATVDAASAPAAPDTPRSV